MALGLSFEALLFIHVVVSLIGIVTGLVAIGSLAMRRWLPSWHAAFLTTTALISLTGFAFPFGGVTPAFVFGLVSSLALLIALFAFPGWHHPPLPGWVYAVMATFAFYLNAFVLIVQSFQKIAALQPLAPTQSEPPFAIAQGALLVAALVFGLLCSRASRGGAMTPAMAH